MSVEPILKILSKQTEFVEQMAAVAGRPRERFVAMSEATDVYFRLYPHYYRGLQMIRIASQLGQTQTGRDSLRPCESRMIMLLTQVINDGVQSGELPLGEGRTSGEVAFTLWSLAFGARALMSTAVATRQLGVRDGLRTAQDAADVMLDALGWQPLSAEWDYSSIRERVRSELYARHREAEMIA